MAEDNPTERTASDAAQLASEEALARRITYERERRGWSPGGLAAQMTKAGHPLNQSSVWKIENGQPRRKITVDEMIGFSKVFELPFDELLSPLHDWVREEIVETATNITTILLSFDNFHTALMDELDRLRTILEDVNFLGDASEPAAEATFWFLREVTAPLLEVRAKAGVELAEWTQQTHAALVKFLDANPTLGTKTSKKTKRKG